jgi:hypothetical protein
MAIFKTYIYQYKTKNYAIITVEIIKPIQILIFINKNKIIFSYFVKNL